MGIIIKGLKALKNPKTFVHKLNGELLIFAAPILSDSVFLKLKWRWMMGYPLDLKHPKTYNEKLQWLKLNDRRSEYITMVDKYAAKGYVAKIIGEEHIIPTIGVWDNVEEINFGSLPKQFVLKCTHDSGGVVICKDKDAFDGKAAIEKLRKGLKKSFYYYTREWPYKNVKPRIIAERYMEDESGYELTDYKFFCFKGKPEYMFIATDRYNKEEETKFDFYDMEFNHLPFTNGHPNAVKHIEKPAGFEKMKELAAKLSKGIPHVRVDLYNVNGQIFFGELTFFHWSGFVPFDPEEWDVKFGQLIDLKSITK